jgi:hypothetical protein
VDDNQTKAARDPSFKIKIRIVGQIDEHWSDWFEGLAITHTEENVTVLTGRVADQAVLYGLLANLGALGLPLLSVNRIEDQA